MAEVFYQQDDVIVAQSLYRKVLVKLSSSRSVLLSILAHSAQLNHFQCHIIFT